MANDDGATDDEGEPLGPADAMMMRGEYLRKLRILAEEDEAERRADGGHEGGSVDEDEIFAVGGGERRILRYSSYLSHQRYYDDLKHVDVDFIDYRVVSDEARTDADEAPSRKEAALVIEQDKSLGKGGLCWDAAFILAEHMISRQSEWLPPFLEEGRRPRLVELGSGTGLAGLMVAKAVPCHVAVTDLPELMGLLKRNVQRNFRSGRIEPLPSMNKEVSGENPIAIDMEKEEKAMFPPLLYPGLVESAGSVTARVLRWGHEFDYGGGPYDVVFGADVVASLYDPVALARTFHGLSSSTTTVLLSYKGRLSGPHEKFEAELGYLFGCVERIRPASRNRNPGVWILKATKRIGI